MGLHDVRKLGTGKITLTVMEKDKSASTTTTTEASAAPAEAAKAKTDEHKDEKAEVKTASTTHSALPKPDDLAYIMYTSGTTGVPKVRL